VTANRTAMQLKNEFVALKKEDPALTDAMKKSFVANADKNRYRSATPASTCSSESETSSSSSRRVSFSSPTPASAPTTSTRRGSVHLLLEQVAAD